MLRCCYVSGWGLSGVGWDNNIHVTCVHSKGIFCIKKRKNGVPCLCTPVVSMECGKSSKVQPPCLPYVYTPPCSYISIKCMKGRGGRWSSPATERGVKKVYTLLFLIQWDMGGTCLAPAQSNIWEAPSIPLGGELLLWTINSLQVKNLKMYEA